MTKKKVSVYGYGRFGRFWADLLARDFNVQVFSRRGLKREEVPDEIEITDQSGIFKSDAIFFCVAISSMENVLRQNSNNFTEDCVYFDTCSVKVEPTRWMKEILPVKAQIIATHPMFGPDSFYHSKEKLPMVMSDVRTKRNTFNEWVEYFEQKSMRVEVMTPDQHDEMVAYSQGITHYIGRVLADLHLDSTKINTLGYVKLLEIIEQTCNDSWQLFMDLQKFNPYTKKMRIDLHKSLEKIYSLINNGG